MNRSNIWREMKGLCRRAEVSPSKVFPHSLRHLFARCFYSLDHDVAKLKEYDVSVASCPRINAQLGMGVAPLAEFLNNGLRVGWAPTVPPPPTPPT